MNNRILSTSRTLLLGLAGINYWMQAVEIFTQRKRLYHEERPILSVALPILSLLGKLILGFVFFKAAYVFGKVTILKTALDVPFFLFFNLGLASWLLTRSSSFIYKKYFPDVGAAIKILA